MKILFTGATGFVGRNLVPELQKSSGIQILAVCRDIEKTKKIFPQNKIICATLDDVETIVNFEPEIVIHLASTLTSKNDRESVDKILDSNIVFGVHLLDVLKNCKSLKLFFNVGSCVEYRKGVARECAANFYGATKTAFRSILNYYSDLCGFKFVNVIPYTIYGGKDSQKKLIDFIVESFESSIPVKMSAGEQILDFIHVADVVDFFCFGVKNLEKFLSLENGEVLHLGTGVGTQIRELVKILENKFSKKANIEWGALPYRDMDLMFAIAPIEKLQDLGWQAKIKLEDF